METKKQLVLDMKQAMKSGDTLKKTTIRMLLSELQYAQTAQSKDYVLSEEEACKVIKSYHKKLDKSLKDYPEGEQKNKIIKELELVAKYLPKAPSRTEVEAAVTKAIALAGDKNFGKIMKATLAELGPFAEAKVVSEVIKEKTKDEKQ